MSADREKGVDESTKAPQSREPTGQEDETQTAGTQGATRNASPPAAGADIGSDSGRGKDKQSGSGKAPLSPPPPPGGPADSSRAGDAAAAAAATGDKPPPEKVPASLPRCGTSSMSRKKRQKAKKAKAAAAAAAGGTIEDTNPQETEHGGMADDAGYPGLHEARIWKHLEFFRRSNYFHRFPVEPPPEQLVADLCETYVRTIELTMEKRHRNIYFNRWLTILLCIPMLGMLADFVYNHLIKADDLFILDTWKGLAFNEWPPFIYPLIVHFVTWPLVTVPLVFTHHNFRYYLIAVNAYKEDLVTDSQMMNIKINYLINLFVNQLINFLLLPMFSIMIAAGFVLFLPYTDLFSDIVEKAIDGVMKSERHLEDASTEATREKIAGVYPYVALWAVGQSFSCCLTFFMSTRNLSALRYYDKYSFESEHPAHTTEHVERYAHVGQCTKRVPLTKYQNIAETHGSRTPRTPASRSVPNSPMAATAVAETTPLL
ncbi:hypothetical protein PRIPAC_94469 [Pristionchus pacificus]|uniref:Uncharacterized protein n=1 Tax=Pristionchus pacificus TaxID=54126 RepID=A0A2A6CEM5_PRIPA|nr:hypothetical protein PRIPAC_94469 [Pristionchus pacificus]|eukprot:PDM76461.1 hypothetical protein PRIPAC_40065 [Pristionchus pacificus]